MLVTTAVSKPRDMGCSKDLLSLAENVFVFLISPLFWILWVQQGVKDIFPIQRVNVGQADWSWAWGAVEEAKEQPIKSPSILAWVLHQCCLLPAGSPYKWGYHCQSDRVSLGGGEQEPAGSFSQNQVSWTCNYNNYQDPFLLPLSPAGSGCCNIPSASLPKHTLGRQAWIEIKWPGSNRELSASRSHAGSTC